MSQAILVKLKFKAGRKQIWLDWCEQLKKRTDEVIETLKNEGTLSEACFISRDGEDLYYYAEVEDVERARQAFRSSTYKIDQEHRQAQGASLEKVEELSPVFYFRNE